MHRTIRILLQPSLLQAFVLRQTIRQFTKAFNHVCKTGWDLSEKNGVTLHHLTYYPLREQFPGLHSDHVCQARNKAVEALKSAFSLKKQGRKVSCPHAISCPPRLIASTLKVNWEGFVRISTIVGRHTIPFTLPEYYRDKLGKVCSADLIQRKNKFWLHIVVDLPVPKVEPNLAVLGIDLGINRPAVTSTAEFLGERRWKDVEAKIFRQRRNCQKKGTKSAKRKLKKLRGNQARFRRDCDHVLSKRIVESCPPGGTVVLENLTNIRKRVKGRKRQRRRLHSWSFAQLKGFVIYKAEGLGIKIELIDPRHTSQTCSQCGHQHRSNRKSQSLFHCRSCGFQLNADLNAARNIRAKHLGTFGTPLSIRPSSTGPTSGNTQSSSRRSPTSKSGVG